MKLHEPSPGLGTFRGHTGHRRHVTFVASLISKMADPYALAFEDHLEGCFDASDVFRAMFASVLHATGVVRAGLFVAVRISWSVSSHRVRIDLVTETA